MKSLRMQCHHVPRLTQAAGWRALGAPSAPSKRTHAAASQPPCALPPVMVNSCTGKMGHEVATALVLHGFTLVPHTFSGLSAGVAVNNIGVRGVPVSILGREKRQAAMDGILAEYPNMMVVDYTLAHCVEDHAQFYADNGVPFVMGTSGGDRMRVREICEAAGVTAVLPSPAGEQAASLHALLVSLGAPLPPRFEQYSYEPLGPSRDVGALDLLDPGAAPEIAAALRGMGIQCNEAQVHRMRAARYQRAPGHSLGREGEPPSASALHALQGRGTARACRLSLLGESPGGGPDGGPGGGPTGPSLLLRHYGLDRAAFAVGAVEAARFLAERLEERGDPRVYDMVDVLRAMQARQAAAQRAGAAERGAGAERQAAQGAERLGREGESVVAAGASVEVVARMRV